MCSRLSPTIAAIRSLNSSVDSTGRVITRSYSFFIAMWRAKKAELGGGYTMKRITSLYNIWLVAAGILGITLLGPCMMVAHAESDGEVEHFTRSPDGSFRVERQIVQGEGRVKVWIIPTAEPAKRVALGEPFDDTQRRTFFISPDGRWICATVHFNSQLNGLMLYRRKADFQFELVTTDDSDTGDQHSNWDFESGDGFADCTSDWDDFGGVHDYFVAWSADSARLLVEKVTRERDAKTRAWLDCHDFFYFNLRRGKLEHTQYLRTLIRTFRDEEGRKNVVPSFAEPLDPLRPEKEILGRYEAAEQRLNKSFSALLELKTSEKEKGGFWDYQHLWLKARDSAGEAFAASGPKAEHRCRKLQYLADATENRARELEEYVENFKDSR